MGGDGSRQKLTKKVVDALCYPEDKLPPVGRRRAAAPHFVWDKELRGFGVRVFPDGRKAFVIDYRDKETRKRHRSTVGHYPALTVDKAREKALAELGRIATQGGNPVAEKKNRAKGGTVSILIDEYLERWAKPRKRSWEEDARQLRGDVEPAWGKLKSADITRRDVRLLVEAKAEKAPIAANRLLAVIRRMFNWAVEQDILETSPAYQVKAPATENRKDRVLSREEIRTVWSAWQSAGATPEVRRALRLILATAQRPGEVAAAHWSEFDLTEGVWTIPAEKAKNGQAHRVPISDLALEILGPAGQGYVFPSSGRASMATASAARDHLNPAALTRACYRHARMEPLPVKSKSRGIRKRHVPPVAWKVAPFTPHGLRRTAASTMTSIGVPRLTVGKILNHVERGVTAIYDRHSYDQEKRDALRRWGESLTEIAGNGTGNGSASAPGEEMKAGLEKIHRMGEDRRQQ